MTSVDKMLKALRHIDLYRHDGFESTSGSYFADKLKEAINNCYLPRPQFEDGEPVQFGEYASDPYDLDELIVKVDRITITTDGAAIFDEEKKVGRFLENGRRFKRCFEPDTQEKIDADVLVGPAIYCHNHGIKISDEMDYLELSVTKTLHLLERQRKLCEETS